MWETIEKVLTSPNATSTLLFLAVCGIGGIVLVKSGFLQVHTTSLQIGAADVERNIIRQQLDYVMAHLQEVENNLDKPKGYNEYLGKYIIERVYDEYVRWVTFNHISKSEKYIKAKQESLVSVVGALVQKDEFKTDDFKNFIRKDTEQTLLALIEIREVYGK